MHIQSIVSVRELIEKSGIVLPEEILSKKIELSNPDAVEENDFYIHYDKHKKSLELRYMVYDERYDNYWDDVDVGELINGSSSELCAKIGSLNEDKCLYFLVATYEHGLVKHYPVHSHNDISTCRWDTGIRSIFVPSDSFIEECNNDSEQMMNRLTGYFEEYTDWCNGNVYALCTDTYLAGTNDQVIFIDDSDSVGGFIGHQNATENLKSYF